MISEVRLMHRAAWLVASSTLLSRLLGYVRDMAIAWMFGAGLHSDAFIAAFRIPNLLRRLLGEGALSMAFIPVFGEVFARKGRDSAMALAATAFRYLSGILFTLVLLGFWAAPVLVRLVAPGFAVAGEKYRLTLHLVQVLMPYLLVVGSLALSMGVLNALGVFGPPALAPAFLNLGMLGAIFLAWRAGVAPDVGVTWLACGVLVGGLLQGLLQVPALRDCGFRLGDGAWQPDPALFRMVRMLPPAVFGVAVFQINILVGTLLASLLGDGSVSYLFFADRIVQFPLGVIAASAATASLPTFSRQAGMGDMDGLRRTLDNGLGSVVFVMLPAAVGLAVLRRPIVSFLFERGAFGPAAAGLTAQALLWYASGIWAVAAVRFIAPVFFALQDVRSPVLAALASLLLNAAAGAALLGPLGHIGIAMGTALASVLNLILLLSALGLYGCGVSWGRFAGKYARMAACAGAMGMIVHLMGLWWIPDRVGTGMAVGLGACVGGGLLGYVALALLAGVEEARGLMSVLVMRRKR